MTGQTPIPGADAVLSAMTEVLEPEWQAIIIGIDGPRGARKSSLASWLALKLEAPTIHADDYLIRDHDSAQWRYEDLEREIGAKMGATLPVIIEGICLCEVLQFLDREPGSLIWIENQGGPEHGPEEQTDSYLDEFDPVENAGLPALVASAEARIINGRSRHANVVTRLAITGTFAQLEAAILASRTLAIPAAGLKTGRAELASRAPRVAAYIAQRIAALGIIAGD